MAKEMLINVSEGEECRIALVEDGKLEELYMERTSSTSHVGNVYKGKVMNVEPSIQAAFIDFGLGRNGFLHISDLLPTYFGRKGDDVQEFVGKKMARRDRPPIQRCLRRGDEIIVQVIKEGIGTKGPTLSAYLSISGKMLVMMPGVNGRGVSRKIEDEDERRRLKQILDQLDPPEDCGFIIRTESVGKSKAEIERDLKYLARLWEQIKKKRDNHPAPVELYTEGDLVTRTVRDVFSADVDQIVIDNQDVADRVKDVIKLSNPRARNKVDYYDDPIPLFHKYGIEGEIEQMYSRHVPLRSGGSLVIDSTEAIVAIDVNSGKNRENSDAEMTAFRTDMEAADEICRQLKLRDLGGVIIVDFIDLRYERHRRELEERLEENLKNDRAKTKVLRMSQFGIIEMTRQRMRPSLKRSVYFDCPHCKGAGLVKTPESMSLDVMRRLAIAIHDQRVVRVELSANPDVASYLLNKKRMALADLEGHTRKQILVRSDVTLGLDEMRLDLFDNRDGVVIISELAAVANVPHKTQLNTRPQPHPPRGARPGLPARDGRRPGQRPALPPGRQRDNRPPREDFDQDVDAMEDRTEGFDRAAEETGAPSPEVSSTRRRQGEDQDSRHDDRDERPREHEDAEQAHFGTEAASEADEGVGADDSSEGAHNGEPRGEGDADGQQEGDGTGRRRRRRRRRRGRGRGGAQPQENGQPMARDDRGGRFDEPVDAGRDEGRGNGGAESRGNRDQGQGSDNRQRPQQRRREGRIDRYEPQRPPEPPVPAAASDEAEDRYRDFRQDDSERDEARAGNTDEAEMIVEEDVIEADEHGERVESVSTTAYRETVREQPDETADAPADVTEEAPAKPKRARGTRGGRGRGKKKAAPAEAVQADAPDAQAEPAKPKRARAPRGGKGRRQPPASASASETEGTEPSPARGNASASGEPEPAPSVARSGSTDRHLADDEPVLHEPVRRPRSVRDLDHIPEDYD